VEAFREAWFFSFGDSELSFVPAGSQGVRSRTGLPRGDDSGSCCVNLNLVMRPRGGIFVDQRFFLFGLVSMFLRTFSGRHCDRLRSDVEGSPSLIEGVITSLFCRWRRPPPAATEPDAGGLLIKEGLGRRHRFISTEAGGKVCLGASIRVTGDDLLAVLAGV